jgi:hypothetical protein
MEMSQDHVQWQAFVSAVYISYLDLWEICCEVDGNGSVSCSMADFGISSVEASGSATRGLVGWLVS